MALIQCHECRVWGIDPAPTCPHCGAPVTIPPTVKEILDEQLAMKLI